MKTTWKLAIADKCYQNLPNLSVKEDSCKIIVFLVLATVKLPKIEKLNTRKRKQIIQETQVRDQPMVDGISRHDNNQLTHKNEYQKNYSLGNHLKTT